MTGTVGKMKLRSVDRILLLLFADVIGIIVSVERYAGGDFQGNIPPLLGDADVWFDKPAVIAKVY